MDESKLRYAPTHEWVHIDGDTATIGISKFAVEQLTDLILIDLPKIGASVEAGKSLGEVESVKAVSDIYAPVSGEVSAVNADVSANVQILGDDPYGKGWLVKIKMSDPAQVRDLLDHAGYQKAIAESPH